MAEKTSEDGLGAPQGLCASCLVCNLKREDRPRQHISGLTSVSAEDELTVQTCPDVISLLNATFSSSPDGIVVINSASNIAAYNRAFAALWDFPAYLHVGMNRWDFANRITELFFHPGSSPIEILRMQSQVRDQAQIDDVRLKDGRIFMLHSIPQYVESKWVGTVTTWRDVTSQRHAEHALKARQEMHQSLMQGLQEGVVLISCAKGIMEANASAEAIAGQTLAQMRGSYLINSNWQPIHEDGSPIRDEDRIINTVLRTRQPQSSLVSGFRKPNGEVVWLSINATPLMDNASNSVVDIVVSFSDVTARKRSSELQHELESQLRASQKMESLGTLAGGIAHDFNNILGAIIGNASLAQQDVGSNLAVDVCLNEIQTAANRAKELVKKILAFSRKGVHDPINQPLDPLIQEALGILRATIPAGITLQYVPNGPAVWASVDATEIVQVLLNLCTNARQAIGSKTGHIAISMKAVTLESLVYGANCTLEPGQYVRIAISDSGCGMDPATVARIFDPFFTTKPVDQGTGLGLSVVHGIVMKHGGGVLVRSTLGEGTVFEIYLPQLDPVLVTEDARDAGKDSVTSMSGKHILYLDDEEPMVFLVRRILQRRGFTVSGFVDPVAALAAIRQDPDAFDIVVTDYNMPRLSGIKVTEEIRTMSQSLPVIITSGYIDEHLKQRASQLGVQHVLYKPNTAADLCKTIELSFSQSMTS